MERSSTLRSKPLHNRPADFAGPYHVYKRPNVQHFLATCVQLFEVGIWTTASRSYAEWIVRELLPEPTVLAFVWTHERCTQHYDCESHEYQERKRLKKLTRKSLSGGKYPLSRIIVVDDTPSTFKDNYGNGIRVAEYRGEQEDVELTLLLKYLQMIGGVRDVRVIEKRAWRSKVRSMSKDT